MVSTTQRLKLIDNIPTKRALAFHESVCQECFVLLAIRLRCCPLLEIAILVELEEDVLRNVGLLLRWRSTKVIELNAKPIVDFLMNLVVFVAQLFTRDLLF